MIVHILILFLICKDAIKMLHNLLVYTQKQEIPFLNLYFIFYVI